LHAHGCTDKPPFPLGDADHRDVITGEIHAITLARAAGSINHASVPPRFRGDQSPRVRHPRGTFCHSFRGEGLSTRGAASDVPTTPSASGTAVANGFASAASRQRAWR
jgi:hypothetical protein